MDRLTDRARKVCRRAVKPQHNNNIAGLSLEIFSRQGLGFKFYRRQDSVETQMAFYCTETVIIHLFVDIVHFHHSVEGRAVPKPLVATH